MGIKEIVLEYKSLETMLHDYAVQLIAYLQVVKPSSQPCSIIHWFWIRTLLKMCQEVTLAKI